MGDVVYVETPSTQPMYPHHHNDPSKSNFPMLYYGLVVIGTAALVLLTYNLIIIRWCTVNRHTTTPPPRSQLQLPNSFFEVSSSGQSLEDMNRNLLCSFKYKKKKKKKDESSEYDDEFECAVCLCVFEEGEEVRTLPQCTHTFHAPCIDMWLYSHSDCPLCRSPVVPALCHRQMVAAMPEGSGGSGLLV